MPAFATNAEEKCQSSPYPIVAQENYEHDRWVSGAEPAGLRVAYGGFVAMFDGPDDDDDDPTTPNLLYQPEWVAHEIHEYSKDGKYIYPGGYERPRPWYSLAQTKFENGSPESADLDASYAGEGRVWNRGHMATRSPVNRVSAEAGCNSHIFPNAVPQFWALNQGKWLALERYTGALANKYGKAWAISGPIFFRGQVIETIGAAAETKIPIPHAVFKVIVFDVDGDIFVRAFLFPQPIYALVKEIIAANGGKNPGNGVPAMPGSESRRLRFFGVRFVSYRNRESDGNRVFPGCNR